MINLPISVIIITKNEEHNIRSCLNALSFATEIIILDSGSTDKTLEICNEFSNTKIFLDTNWQGFGYQKNLALQYATHDWIFSIDADEIVTEKLAHDIQQIITNPKFNAYQVLRKFYFQGKLIKHGLWRKDYIVRLFNRQSAKFSAAIIHEKIVVNGTIGKLKGYLLHNCYVNLHEVLHKMNLYSTEGAKLRHQKGKTGGLFKALVHGLWTFVRSYFLFGGFIDGKMGFVFALSSAQTTYYTYLKLAELDAHLN